MCPVLGFRPWEISTLVNHTVLAQHAEDAAFLWGLRERATSQAHYLLEDLIRLDDRVEGNLEGLRVDDAAGWRTARARLATVEAESVFVLSVLALSGHVDERTQETFVVARSVAGAERGMVAALAWLGPDQAVRWARVLLRGLPDQRRIAVSALRCLRVATPGDLIPALLDSDVMLRVCALRAVGECKVVELRGPIRELLRDQDHLCRLWAAWALTLLGDPDGLDALLPFVAKPSPEVWRAMQLALRAAPFHRSREVVRELAGHAGTERLVVAATGFIGDPQVLPWLLARMEDPSLARIAGEAFSSVTGVDLGYEDLVQEVETEIDATASPSDHLLQQQDWLPPDYEQTLPLPHPTKIAAWWQARNPGLVPGQRYLCGEPISVAQSLRALGGARQRQRAAAALELALLQPQTMLFDVHARGRWQRKRLRSWTS